MARLEQLITFAVLPFAASAAASAEVYYSWPIGKQREVDEGVYMSVTAVRSGWRVWQVERKNGTSCFAAKSARGRPDPIPVGVDDALYNGTPFLTISKGYRGEDVSYHWKTEHYGRVKVKIRKPGAKFWDEHTAGADMTKYAEGPLEVTLTSWEYPEILVGYAEEKAIFDLTGRDWAAREVLSCSIQAGERG